MTVTVVGKMFPFTSSVNIETNLPFILTALKNENLTDAKMVLVALATIRAEAESFEPISELISRLIPHPEAAPLIYTITAGTWAIWARLTASAIGAEGFVQLTGRSNYQQYGKNLWGLAPGLSKIRSSPMTLTLQPRFLPVL